MAKIIDELVQFVRAQLDPMAAEIAEAMNVEPVVANPRKAYCDSLGEQFWQRASWIETPERAYVDGYNGQCNWNTAMAVVREAGGGSFQEVNLEQVHLASPRRVYRGYAFSPQIGPLVTGWCEHTWCMDEEKLIETTGPFVAYFGAELNAGELAHFCAGVINHLPTPNEVELGWTVIDGVRQFVPAEHVQEKIGLPSIA